MKKKERNKKRERETKGKHLFQKTLKKRRRKRRRRKGEHRLRHSLLFSPSNPSNPWTFFTLLEQK